MSSGNKTTLWTLGGLTQLELGQRIAKRIGKDEVSLRSGSLAYYFVLAIFPALLFLLCVIGFLIPSGSHLQQTLFSNLSRMLPGSAAALVQKTLQEVSRGSGSGKALIGIVGALWAASNGVTAMMQSLNTSYQVQENRAWWKQRAIAVGLTVCLACLVLAGLGLTLFGNDAADYLGAHGGLGRVLVWLWKVVQWPVVLALLFAAFALVYYFAPNLKKPEWHWITPGGVAALLVWILASLGFKLYLHYFNSYSKTYGSLGAAIILLVWLYLSGFCILLGGEINSEIGRAEEAKRAHEEKLRQTNSWLRAG